MIGFQLVYLVYDFCFIHMLYFFQHIHVSISLLLFFFSFSKFPHVDLITWRQLITFIFVCFRTVSDPRLHPISCQKSPKPVNTSSLRWSASMELPHSAVQELSFWIESPHWRRTIRSCADWSMDCKSLWSRWKDAWINWMVDRSL